MIPADQKSQILKYNAKKAMSMASDHPWNVTTPEELGPCISTFIDWHEPYFRKWAESWFMTMQYVFGQHNFRWSNKNGYAVDYDSLKDRQGGGSSSYVRAYTNIARIAVESLASGLYASAPTWDVDAVGDSATAGRKQKRIISKLLDGMFDTMMCDKDTAAAAFVFSMFGQVAFESLWNPMAGRVMTLKQYEDKQGADLVTYMADNPAIPGGLFQTPTPQTDSSGRPYLTQNVSPARDASGKEVYRKIYSGNNQMNVLTPFEYRRAVGSIGMHRTRYVQIFKLMDYDQWLDFYSQIPGKNKNFGAIEPVTSTSSVYQFAMRFYARLMFITPPSGSEFGSRWGANMVGGVSKKVLVVEHYDEPHPEKWGEGRRVIVSNGLCTHITKPDYNTNKIDGWHPLSEAQWMNSYPSSIASGPMQDLVKKNRELDVMDSFIATAMRRSLGGQYLVKTGSGIDPNRLTGEPGMVHEVTDPYGIRILHDDMAIPPVVAEIRNMQKEDAYAQAGALESQRGVVDEGSSGYQTRLFEEREDKRLSPARKSFRNALAGAGEKNIYCLHKNVIKLDDQLMGYLIQNAAGEFTPSDVISFLATPLNIGNKIRITDTSMLYKSSASLKADIAQMVSSNPAFAMKLSTDAKLYDQYLKIYGLEHMRDKSAAQRDRAERENETFLDMISMGPQSYGMMLPRVLFEDDDLIHDDEHTEFMIRYYELVKDNPEFMLAYYQHVETHRMQREVKAAKLLPGAALLTGQMQQLAGAQQPPNLQQVSMDAQMKQLMAASAPAAGMAPGQNAKPGFSPNAKATEPGAPPGNPVA